MKSFAPLAQVAARSAGVASDLDVVEAEQNLLPAQLALAATIGARFVAQAQLYRALGEGWQVPRKAATGQPKQ